MNQLFYSIAGGIVHQIRSEKLQQYQKWLFVVSEILSKIGIGFISNFLLKARVLSSEKFTLTFEGWNRPVCHLFGFTRVSFCQKLSHFTLGQWSEPWRRWCRVSFSVGFLFYCLNTGFPYCSLLKRILDLNRRNNVSCNKLSNKSKHEPIFN